jgi:protein-S-isoprenylcysteine O-methyltransferase Ste14
MVSVVPATVRMELLLFWAAFFYPFLFRAPHWQKRGSVVAKGASRAGILLEAIGISGAFWYRLPGSPGTVRMTIAPLLAFAGALLAWMAVAHLGRQFRIQAALWEDHELIRTGPYAVVRHPIYAALLLTMLATLALCADATTAAISLAIFLTGTEIRVRTEDRLLASRFGAAFDDYKKVPAYLPGIR